MAKVRLPMYIVDAFTSIPFSGNPAGVCLVEDPKRVTEKQRRQIASEMNIPTAFLEISSAGDSFDKGDHFNLTWFSPTTELTLCGHVTLATTAVLADAIGNQSKEFIFQTRKRGQARTRKQDGLMVTNFPQSTTRNVDRNSVESLLKLLCPADLVEDVQYSPEVNDLLVKLKPQLSRKQFESLSPNVTELTEHGKYRGVILTIKAVDSQDDQGRPYDYFSRVFSPWVGIDEDSVTGSSFTITAPYWKQILGKSKMYARQCSTRGGDVSVQILDEGRLEISGASHINLQGFLTL